VDIECEGDRLRTFHFHLSRLEAVRISLSVGIPFIIPVTRIVDHVHAVPVLAQSGRSIRERAGEGAGKILAKV
jgi:hypothetical protein